MVLTAEKGEAMMENEVEFKIAFLRGELRAKEESFINEVFFLWKGVWAMEFKKTGGDPPSWPDEFYRHDAIGAILVDSVPIAVHLYSIQNINLKACEGQDYFKSYTREFTSTLKRERFARVLAASWMTVNPDFKLKDKKVSFSKCLLALSQKMLVPFNCEAAIGATRSDNGLAERIMSWGAKSYGPFHTKNTPVEMLLMDEAMRIPLTADEEELVNNAYESINMNLSPAKKAA